MFLCCKCRYLGYATRYGTHCTVGSYYCVSRKRWKACLHSAPLAKFIFIFSHFMVLHSSILNMWRKVFRLQYNRFTYSAKHCLFGLHLSGSLKCLGNIMVVHNKRLLLFRCFSTDCSVKIRRFLDFFSKTRLIPPTKFPEYQLVPVIRAI